MRTEEGEKKPSRTILAITDFSKSSTSAILLAANLLKNSDLNLLLLNAYETPNEKASLLISVEDILSKDSEAGLKRQEEEIYSIFKLQKLNVSIHSMSGKLNKAIGKIIQEVNVDLIITGIPSNKYPAKYINNIPILFMGQSNHPVLLVPENCSEKSANNILILNLYSGRQENIFNNKFKQIVNHNHISSHVINLSDKKRDIAIPDLLHHFLLTNEENLIIIAPSPGDKIDKAMLEYRILDLLPSVVSLLNS